MTSEGTNDERSASEEAPERGIEGRLASVLLPAFVRRRYAVKFVLTLLLVAIIVAALGTVTYLEVSGITQENAETKLQSTATLQAHNVAEWLSGMRTQTIAAASGPVYAGTNTTRI